MGTAVFKKSSGELVNWASRGELSFDPDTEVAAEFEVMPDINPDTHFFNAVSMKTEARTESEVRSRTYKKNREREYPEIGDQLDAIWRYLSNGILDPQAQAMMDQINEVKGNYPKQ